jgi:hypothetical protein
VSQHHFDDIHALAQIAQSDYGRAGRTDIPEIILSDRKSIEQTLAITLDLVEREGRAILSRVSPDLLAALRECFPELVETGTSEKTVVVRRHDHHVSPTGGRVGVLSAGTSDIPVAEEAATLCREAGCGVQSFYDVGVAGLHRLREPLEILVNESLVDVIIVAAGMDGALPSVVSGLVNIPIVGLPTSVGYGMGGQGVAALLSMLQGCAPGLAVVNIDNGIGAGAMAVRIANRAAAARRGEKP